MESEDDKVTKDRFQNRKKLNPYWEFGGGIREKKKNFSARFSQKILLIIDSGEHPKIRIRWTLVKKTNSEHQLEVIVSKIGKFYSRFLS